MSGKTFAGTAACLAALAALISIPAFAQSAPATLTIHADQPASTVSPTLYGLMTEEINFSYDGGLYGELIRNRTLRSDWSGTLYWYLIENGRAVAKMEPEKQGGPSEALPSSLRLDIEKASSGNEAGILNVGYWGIPVRPNTEYKGSLYAKSSGNTGPLTVSLVNNDTGKAAATATVSLTGSDWKQYSFSLRTGAVATSPAYHLAITVSHPGTLWLNLVSLFPPTYKNRPGGFRPDLMEKLAAMHPSFLRFPGGNYLEGDHITTRFDWKKTIGPMVDRPTHPSPWGYQSSDGMGLLEFLDWCEDLNMSPLLAVYAGYSLHQEHVNPGSDLEPYVQDALDEIEYVAGSADTKWGAVRAKDGHPQPFKLTYVEIGNEEWFDKSGSYDERYAQFAKAIQAKYPDLKLIATAPVKNSKPDVIDEHFYVRATQNFHTAHRYDAPGAGSSPDQQWDNGHFETVDRNGPKIFVGEWATREGSPTPNMGAALGDAAWMTGLERNSDVVVMASYAPLLVNVNPGGMQWETDLIGYDTMTSYGSPAYYAQVMFGSHVGDHTLASKLDNAGDKVFYSVTADSTKKKVYLKLVNAATTPQTIEINLEGGKPGPSASVATLSAKDTQATNTIDHPREIVPVDSTLNGVSEHLHHTMPALSIQVIQFEMK